MPSATQCIETSVHAALTYRVKRHWTHEGYLLLNPKMILVTKFKVDFSYYQSNFWLSWAVLERVSSLLLCKATQHLIPCFTANLTARCLLSITTELLSFIFIISLKVITFSSGSLAFGSLRVIILPWTEEDAIRHQPRAHNRNQFTADRAQQRRECLPILWTQLKGCTQIMLDSTFQLLSPLSSRCQCDPSSVGNGAEEEWALGSATQQQQSPGVHLSLQPLCRHRLLYLGLLQPMGGLPQFSWNDL